jgi:hypothetical protein
MARSDICDDVAAIHFPPPTPPVPGEDTDQAADADHERWERNRQLRDEHAEQLRLRWHEADIDPLLGEIRQARADMLEAERRMRLLIAYAREFVRPRPYRLEDLAHAASLSMSGVRIAYDDDEIDHVTELTDQKPRRASTTSTPA